MIQNLSRKELEEKYQIVKAELDKRDEEFRDLKKSEEKFKHLFEKSPVAIFVTNWQGVILNINTAGVKQMGYNEKSEIIRINSIFNYFNNPKDKKQFVEILEIKGAIYNFETTVKCKNGKILNVQITMVTREGITGKLDGFEGYVRDITDAKRMELELRTSEVKYRTVVEGSLACIYVFHSKGTLQYVNQRLLDVLGYEYDELIGRPFWELVCVEDREQVKQNGLKREIEEIEPRHYPFRLIKKDGTVIWTDSYGTHTTFQGKPAVVGNFIDISKIRQAEEEIRQFSRKLITAIEEERKNLAVDLHDEFGQNLTTLQIDIKLIEQALPKDFEEQRARCNIIMDRINSLADSVRSTSSRLRPELLDHLGLKLTIQSHVDEYNSRDSRFQIDFIASGIDKRLGPSTELALYRIFQEALNNTIKHAQADSVTIRLTCDHQNAILAIKDNGIGFKAEENILSKSLLIGGIGILSMKERVAMLKGNIIIHSKLGKGTMIRIELPIEEATDK